MTEKITRSFKGSRVKLHIANVSRETKMVTDEFEYEALIIGFNENSLMSNLYDIVQPGQMICDYEIIESDVDIMVSVPLDTFIKIGTKSLKNRTKEEE